VHPINAVLVAVLAASALLMPRAGFAQPTIELSARHLSNVTKFSGVQQSAIEALIPSRPGESGRFTLDWVVSGGTLIDRAESSSFVSVGRALTLRVPRVLRGAALQASFSPTWTEADSLNARDFGGHFYFTTALSFRLFLDPRHQRAIALRAQHTSNGGLAEANPGLDLAGLELTWRFGDG